jgi:hypothetical protein
MCLVPESDAKGEPPAGGELGRLGLAGEADRVARVHRHSGSPDHDARDLVRHQGGDSNSFQIAPG